MAESKNNIITHGLSGKFGDLIVFRSRLGKTFVSSKPKKQTGEPSEAQKARRKMFQQAVIYARTAINDPQIKKIYSQGVEFGRIPYNVALADFLHAPDIHEIDLSGYYGKPGDKIKVTVTDDFKVKEVTVTILNADGTELEHGKAEEGAGTLEWVFTAKVENATLKGDKIIVRASDLPGNISEKEEIMR